MLDVVGQIGRIDLIFDGLREIVQFVLCVTLILFQGRFIDCAADVAIAILIIMAERFRENCTADGTRLCGRARRSRTGCMARGLDLGVGRVIATAALFISIPADFRARRSLRVMLRQVMSELLCKYRTADVAGLRSRACCSHTGRMARGLDLFVGCVVTAAASLIGVPTDLCAGRCLCLVLLEVVPERFRKNCTADGTRLRGRARCSCARRVARGFDLGVGRVIAAAARLVGIPTDLRARRGLCLMLLNVVAECRDRMRCC